MHTVGSAIEFVCQTLEWTGELHEEHDARDARRDKHKRPIVPHVLQVLQPLFDHSPHLKSNEHAERSDEHHTVDQIGDLCAAHEVAVELPKVWDHADSVQRDER